MVPGAFGSEITKNPHMDEVSRKQRFLIALTRPLNLRNWLGQKDLSKT
jgi:hypothetical protein